MTLTIEISGDEWPVTMFAGRIDDLLERAGTVESWAPSGAPKRISALSDGKRVAIHMESKEER